MPGDADPQPRLSLERIVDAASAVAATSSRSEKGEILADLLQQATVDEIPVVVPLLVGTPRQGRIGVGWATVAAVVSEPAATPTLTVLEVDATFDDLAAATGPGSQQRRVDLLARLLSQATDGEMRFLRSVLTGGLRQGALEGVMVSAVARAFAVPIGKVRRALMLSGDLGETAAVAATGGAAALDQVGLRVLRAVKPMLAATATSAGEAVQELGRSVVQAKLDGIRIQAHRDRERVRLFTRNLNDVTDRLPDLASLVSRLDVESVVLDGEVIGIAEDAPELFQDTAATFSSGAGEGRVELDVQFFDILHRDGRDLIDDPLEARLGELGEVVGAAVVDGIVTEDPAEAEGFARSSVARGHEGVMVKAAGSAYAAGRRGKAWRKVKPVHTVDLVVLGAEWGHGRRVGWLSNLHLGARDADRFVMVGKTFKGLTDELLAWQTEALLEREIGREGIAVFVEPELVAEIALDGVQRSTTYPGGLALRFARVRRYRPDKRADEAATLDELRALFR